MSNQEPPKDLDKIADIVVRYRPKSQPKKKPKKKKIQRESSI